MEIYIFGPAYTYARALSHPPHVLTDGHLWTLVRCHSTHAHTHTPTHSQPPTPTPSFCYISILLGLQLFLYILNTHGVRKCTLSDGVYSALAKNSHDKCDKSAIVCGVCVSVHYSVTNLVSHLYRDHRSQSPLVICNMY